MKLPEDRKEGHLEVTLAAPQKSMEDIYTSDEHEDLAHWQHDGRSGN